MPRHETVCLEYATAFQLPTRSAWNDCWSRVSGSRIDGASSKTTGKYALRWLYFFSLFQKLTLTWNLFFRRSWMRTWWQLQGRRLLQCWMLVLTSELMCKSVNFRIMCHDFWSSLIMCHDSSLELQKHCSMYIHQRKRPSKYFVS